MIISMFGTIWSFIYRDFNTQTDGPDFIYIEFCADREYIIYPRGFKVVNRNDK